MRAIFLEHIGFIACEQTDHVIYAQEVQSFPEVSATYCPHRAQYITGIFACETQRTDRGQLSPNNKEASALVQESEPAGLLSGC